MHRASRVASDFDSLSGAYVTDVSPKELARRAVEQLPEDATLEDAMECLHLLEKIEQGRANVRAGRTKIHEEVIRASGLFPPAAR